MRGYFTTDAGATYRVEPAPEWAETNEGFGLPDGMYDQVWNGKGFTKGLRFATTIEVTGRIQRTINGMPYAYRAKFTGPEDFYGKAEMVRGAYREDY